MNFNTRAESKLQMWVEEWHRDTMMMRYRVKESLFSGRSEFQAVDVVDTYAYGKMLLNDGLVMTTERDEFVYHEMISHVPLFVHPNPRNVLIIGGGDGGTAREVLRHSEVEKVVMVEIDKMVVDACKEHLEVTSRELENPRLEMIIGDGIEYVATTKEQFDVALIDSTDPIGPAQPLFGKEFYHNLHRVLTDDGIVISQAESPFYESEIQKSMLKILGDLFDVSAIYNFSNLTYPGGLWSFTFASKGLHPLSDFRPQRVVESGLRFSYYNQGIHQACFQLPSFMLANLGSLLKL